MKKLLSLILLAAALLSLAACGAKPGASDAELPGADMALSDIMSEILTDVPDLPGVADIPLDEESYPYYLFIDYIDGSEALCSEAAISAVPHSVALLRLPDAAGAADAADAIRQKADPRKWICVEAEKVTVSVNGNLVLLVMSTEAVADAVTANFTAFTGK